jgi:uncharacterized membrane protein
MKWDRPFLITLVYSLFTLLYTVYIVRHSGHSGKAAGQAWRYFLGFLTIGGYLFFIFLGLLYRPKNWGLLLLLPLAVLVAAILIGFILVGLLRIGGGDLLDRDEADMILAAVLFLTGSIYARKWIRPGKATRKK